MASILIVDDDEIACLVTGQFLESGGHEVTYAYDGDTALRQYKQGSFAAVVLDLVMPGKNGLEILSELLEADGNARVIMVSGSRDGELALAKDVGAIEILGKPVSCEDLLSALRSAIDAPATS